MKGFLNFIREQGVIGLAIGFILGTSIAKVVSSLVTDIINPLLGLILGATSNLSSAYLQIGNAKILWGNFFSNVIDFLVLALVVYVAIRFFNLHKLDKKR